MIYNVIYCLQCPRNVSVEKIPSHSETGRTNMKIALGRGGADNRRAKAIHAIHLLSLSGAWYF